MRDLTIDELTSLMADAIFGGEVTKEAAIPRIRLVVEAFMRVKNAPRPVKMGESKAKEKLEANRLVAQQKNYEAIYWRRKLAYFAPNRMPEFYEELENLLVENGLKAKQP